MRNGLLRNPPLTHLASRDKTAFGVHNHTHQYRLKKTPMGLASSSRAYCFVSDTIKAGLSPHRYHNFIDDWICASEENLQTHLGLLRALFMRFRAAGLMLKPAKCHFFQSKIEYLGYVLSENGLTPDERNVEKVKSMEPPATKRKLRRFLGLQFREKVRLQFCSESETTNRFVETRHEVCLVR